jgi:outer membrane biosynthesis protein TonB
MTQRTSACFLEVACHTLVLPLLESIVAHGLLLSSIRLSFPSKMSGERNTEIWSTRLQRELLALTTDNAPEGTKDEIKLVLPPFVTVKEHKLDIEHGNCAVMFQVELPVKKQKPAEEKPKEEEEKPAQGENEDDAKEAEAKKEDEDIPTFMVVTLDASLHKKPDGSVDPIAVAYPFLKPAAILTSGSKAFPTGSTINDGDFIDIEMDWTPSLHLTDAILNISLKIKESILQDEPFYSAESVGKNDPVDEMVNKAKRFGASFSLGLRGMAHIGGEKPDQEKKEKKEKKGMRLPSMKKKEEKKKKAPKANPGEIHIGDEINMLEAPWVDCQGVYSCKAIRRPAFVEEAMHVAGQNLEHGEPQQQQQVRSVFEEDDGEIPEDIGNYMRLQAGSIGQVCALHRASEATSNIATHHLSLLLFYCRLLAPDYQAQVRCSERLPNLPEVYLRNLF